MPACGTGATTCTWTASPPLPGQSYCKFAGRRKLTAALSHCSGTDAAWSQTSSPVGILASTVPTAPPPLSPTRARPTASAPLDVGVATCSAAGPITWFVPSSVPHLFATDSFLSCTIFPAAPLPEPPTSSTVSTATSQANCPAQTFADNTTMIGKIALRYIRPWLIHNFLAQPVSEVSARLATLESRPATPTDLLLGVSSHFRSSAHWRANF